MTDTDYKQPDPTTLEWYLAALKGIHLPCNADEPQTGYYEYRTKNRQTGEVTRRTATFYWYKGKLFYRINGEVFDDRDKGNVIWTYCIKRPIEHQLYQDVLAGRKPWPDDIAPEVKAIQQRAKETAEERVVDRGHNNPPEQLPEVAAAESIDNAIRVAQSEYKAIRSEEHRAQAEGMKNRLADLRLAADKAGKLEYEPHFAAYKAAYNKWHPMVDRASVAEKSIGNAIKEWLEKERRRVAAEQAEIARKQREIDEANARAADRAIAAGAPEPAPVAVEAPKPVAAPEPAKPTYGKRTTKAEVKTWVVVNDWIAAASYFAGHADMQALVTKLAQAEINAGRAVPGCTTREGII
jgi:hypothetical protein